MRISDWSSDVCSSDLGRQQHGEHGPAAPRLTTSRLTTWGIADADAAAVGAHHAVADREADAGALADRLGGEEGIEDARADFGRHAGAAVAHGDAHLPAGCPLGRSLGREIGSGEDRKSTRLNYS